MIIKITDDKYYNSDLNIFYTLEELYSYQGKYYKISAGDLHIISIQSWNEARVFFNDFVSQIKEGDNNA